VEFEQEDAEKREKNRKLIGAGNLNGFKQRLLFSPLAPVQSARFVDASY
jgi:hypothetical protein